MAPLLVAALPTLLDGVKTLIDRVIPDKAAAEKAKQELDSAESKAIFENALAQIAVNQEEAKNPNVFVSGWRPAVGWVGATAFGLTYIPKALVLTGFWCYQTYLTLAHPDVKLPPLPVFPELGVGDVIALLGALLGLGAMRTKEKIEGVARH